MAVVVVCPDDLTEASLFQTVPNRRDEEFVREKNCMCLYA